MIKKLLISLLIAAAAEAIYYIRLSKKMNKKRRVES
jgi:hypothetical protein